MIKILVFGENGQLAKALKAAVGDFPDIELSLRGRNSSGDITSRDSIDSSFKAIKPDLLINAAGYTNVDKAEDEPKAAVECNAVAVSYLKSAAQEAGIPFFHISTDYVFDGSSQKIWHEDDTPAPQNEYGRSKRAGELEALTYKNSYVFRTSWLVSSYGHNFVKTMLKLGQIKEEIGVVADQYGCPTFASDLAEMLLKAAKRVVHEKSLAPGVYHASNQGVTSWYGFAEAIFAEADKLGLKTPKKLTALTTDQYPTKAKRPAYSELCLDKLNKAGLALPKWKDSLPRLISALKKSC